MSDVDILTTTTIIASVCCLIALYLNIDSDKKHEELLCVYLLNCKYNTITSLYYRTNLILHCFYHVDKSHSMDKLINDTIELLINLLKATLIEISNNEISEFTIYKKYNKNIQVNKLQTQSLAFIKKIV